VFFQKSTGALRVIFRFGVFMPKPFAGNIKFRQLFQHVAFHGFTDYLERGKEKRLAALIFKKLYMHNGSFPVCQFPEPPDSLLYDFKKN
jgi:hypothetical protein